MGSGSNVSQAMADRTLLSLAQAAIRHAAPARVQPSGSVAYSASRLIGGAVMGACCGLGSSACRHDTYLLVACGWYSLTSASQPQWLALMRHHWHGDLPLRACRSMRHATSSKSDK